MKELNLPENQLRGWRPRRPSAGLKARIFRTPEENHALAFDWLRLAPAMACLFFVMMVAHFNGGSLWSNQRLLTAGFTNGSGVYYDGDGGQTPENHLAGVTFDWTNHANFQSSMRFASKTNSSD
ncbi:MAG TPA: hypothetical protein VGI63_10620 [Verrucomicrobiae bacterium]